MEVPQELGPSGVALWEGIANSRTIDIVDLPLVLNACRIADRLDELTQALAQSTLVVTNQRGDKIANPLLTEQRQQLLALKAVMQTLGVGKLAAPVSTGPSLADQLAAKRKERNKRQA